jgi:hypothetical protein
MTAAGLITSQLNSPFGAVLVESDVLDSLKNGRLSAQTEMGNAVLGRIFLEVEHRLIAQCGLDVHVTLKGVNRLYLDTLAQGFPRCPQWETSVELFV